MRHAEPIMRKCCLTEALQQPPVRLRQDSRSGPSQLDSRGISETAIPATQANASPVPSDTIDGECRHWQYHQLRYGERRITHQLNTASHRTKSCLVRDKGKRCKHYSGREKHYARRRSPYSYQVGTDVGSYERESYSQHGEPTLVAIRAAETSPAASFRRGNSPISTVPSPNIPTVPSNVIAEMAADPYPTDRSLYSRAPMAQ